MKIDACAVGLVWLIVLVLFLIYTFPDALQYGGWIQ